MLIGFLLISFSIFSQNVELGITGGFSYYLGEINPGKPVLNQPKPTLGFIYRKNLNKRYALRGGVNYAKLAATDKFRSSENAAYRHLSFSSDLWEGYGLLEFNFIPYQLNDRATSRSTPYIFIGLAAFRVAPETRGRNLDKSNSMIALSIPFGVGMKFNLLGNMGFGIEWGMRKTFSDNIDGLSANYSGGYQLSNTQNNDWYSIIGFVLNYKFLTDKDRCNMPGF